MSAHRAQVCKAAHGFLALLAASLGPRRQRIAILAITLPLKEKTRSHPTGHCKKLTNVEEQFNLHTLSLGPRWSTILAQFLWTASHYTDNLSDAAVPINQTWHRPRFHLFVDSREKGADLCKTLFSAAVQGYPPPVLIGYTGMVDIPLGATNIFERALWAISDYRSHVEDGDLVMWLGRNTLTQLPADITVRRFLQHGEAADQKLARKYPDLDLHQRVLFPAGKRRLYGYCNTTDLEALPESSLPRDIYGTLQKETLLEAKFTRPRYLAPGAFMGNVKDVASFLKTSVTASETSAEPNLDESTLWDRLFLDQELTRRNYSNSPFAQLSNTITNILYNQPIPLHNPTTDITTTPPPDLGIHLDYESRLFQPLTPLTSNDITPLTFIPPTLTISPSKLASHLYTSPLLLPPELSPSLSPFEKTKISLLTLKTEKTRVCYKPSLKY
ncbi:hypothetical protein B0T14DRAFT_492636 [Immersiella caudata]|uniref:Uncharacterized protein n=1 Tax=Immersiella caudata TaxID=314043 RepID=A0AA39X2V0_9PEZI|nr:hypothetical protein B0T14DRAFT_492636 [Immersiella caudata]